MNSAIIVFPGSNCERDLKKALKTTIGIRSTEVWYQETCLPEKLDILFIPGGFSFGDYLRCGAIAAKAPIMTAVKHFASRGGYIVGICNGFQILIECGLLKGALTRNSNLKFICEETTLIIENNNTFFTGEFTEKEEIILPIAHHDGCFYAGKDILNELEENNQIFLRYKYNPNGSVNDIAGITSKDRRIVGLMPHPERSVNPLFNRGHGTKIFNSLIKSLE